MAFKTKLVVAGALVAFAASFGATPAFAGEVNGNGDPLTVNARSECAYSGLEDGPPVQPGTTQNWGTIPKADRDFLKSVGISPDKLCNGHLNPIK